MVQTVLDILQTPNPVPLCFTGPGSNTENEQWALVSTWRPWTEFNFLELSSIYQHFLRSTWGGAPDPQPDSTFDQEVWEEQSLDFFLHRFMFPVVNWALRCASASYGWGDEVFYLGPGRWTGMADWNLVSRHRMVDDSYLNLLPGDTKLSTKWQPNMAQSSNQRMRHQWALPVSQVQEYSAEVGCRYGFIITDAHLLVLRMSVEPIAPGRAASRPRRTPSQPPHQRIASGNTDISTSLSAMSLDTGGVSFADDPIHREYSPPEFAVVPWTAHGRRRLTVKMALTCLSLMAAGSDSEIDVSYPPIDSWMQLDKRNFRHITSGVVAKELPQGAVIAPETGGSPSAGGTWDEAAPPNTFDEEVGGSGEDEGDGEEGEGEQEERAEGQGEGQEEEGEGEEEEEGEASQSLSSMGQGHVNAASSTGRPTWYRVDVKKKHGQYVFTTLQGKKKRTKKSEWTKVQGGWTHQGRKNTYFTENLP